MYIPPISFMAKETGGAQRKATRGNPTTKVGFPLDTLPVESKLVAALLGELI